MAPRRGRPRRRKPTPSQPDTPAVDAGEEPADYDDGYQDGFGDGYEEGDVDGYEEGHEDGMIDADDPDAPTYDEPDDEPEPRRRARRRPRDDSDEGDERDEGDALPAPGGRYGKTFAMFSKLNKLSIPTVITALGVLAGFVVDFRSDMLELDKQAVAIEQEKAKLEKDAAESERENMLATQSMHKAIIYLAEESVAMREEITVLTGRLRWIEAQFGDQIMAYPPDTMVRIFGDAAPSDAMGGSVSGFNSGGGMGGGAFPSRNSAPSVKGRKVPGLDVELYEQRAVFDEPPFEDVVEGEEE